MKKRKIKKEPIKGAKSPTSPPSEKSDDTFDFGGLPARDLKKNLGCG